MTDLTIIVRSMTGRMFSTVTTILTVAIAVALMLVLQAMPEAGFAAFSRGAGNMHLLVSRDASPLVAVLNGVFYANAPRSPIEWARYEELSTQFPYEFAVPIQQGDSYRGHPVLATSPEFFSKFSPYAEHDRSWTLSEGRFFEQPFEVVLGFKVARATGLNIGDSLFLTHGTDSSRDESGGGENGQMKPHIHRDFSYEVVGILEPTGGPHDRALMTDLTSTWIIHAHDRRKRDDPNVETTTADDLIEADRLITGIYLRTPTRPGRQYAASLQSVHYALRTESDITVASPDKQVEALFRIVGNLELIFVGIAAVVMVSSGVAIMLALYNSMEQRRRQIAVLRVLGASRGRVFGLVISESALLGVIGAVVGLGVAFVGGQIVSMQMKQRLGLLIEPSLPPRETILVISATVALACLAGVIPSIMAYKTPVVRNLRPIG